jgi:hypothetical protein
MGLYTFSALANIGSFFIGCGVLYLMLRPSQKREGTEEDTVKATSSVNPLAWVFIGGLIFSGYLQFKAASIQFSRSNAPPVQSSSGGPPTTVTEQTHGTPQKDERLFLSRAMGTDDLRDIVIAATQLPGGKKAADYIGKWIRFSGFVKSLQSNSERSYIVFKVNRDDPDIIGSFDTSSVRAATIKVGQTVELICQIDGISSYSISLSECEFPEPPAH